MIAEGGGGGGGGGKANTQRYFYIQTIKTQNNQVSFDISIYSEGWESNQGLLWSL